MYPPRLVLGGTAALLAAACRDAAPTAVSARTSRPAPVVASAAHAAAAAQELMVDQDNSSGFIVDLPLDQGPGGLAQSFTPTANRLDAIDLFLVSNGFNPALTLTIHIRSDSPSGPVLGTTAIPVPAGLRGQLQNPDVVRGVFATPVSLTPGDVYFIQVDPVATQALTFDATRGAYLRGDLYMNGVLAVGDNPFTSDDAAFRTYFATSAPPPPQGPTTREQCKHGGWATFTVPRRFKNQGDCIQYVNTGT